MADKVVVVTAPERTPMGDLPVTPLDIPVDWDDLHDRWTSPVLNLHQDALLADLLNETMDLTRVANQEPLVDSDQEDSEALLAFQDDVASLFAHSPSIDEWTLDHEDEDPGAALVNSEEIDRDIEPSLTGAIAKPEGTEEGHPCEPTSREKRHGRVLVTKELKLCLDVDIAQSIYTAELTIDEGPKRRRKSEMFEAGESFLMMASPLSPESGGGIRTSYLW